MNVLILIRRFDFGGAENYVRELANALSERGNEVFVLAKKGRQHGLLSPHVTFQSVNFSKWLLPINFLFLLFYAKIHKIEVIHAHQPSAILAGSLLGKFMRIPVMVTIHSTTALELWFEFTRRTPTRLFYISRYTMEHSDWYSSLQPKCRYIANGIMPREYISPGEGRRLVYCSRIDKSHAGLLHMLIEEVMPQLKEKFPDIVLEVVGDGVRFKQVEKWAKHANNLLGVDTVVLGGFKEQFITNGFLVIGVGRVALEALSFGIPVLAVNGQRCGPRISSANYEILSQTNFVDVAADKPKSDVLVESITEICRNYHTVVEDSRYLREKVNTEFSLANMVDKIQQEYREAIDESRAGDPRTISR